MAQPHHHSIGIDAPANTATHPNTSLAYLIGHETQLIPTPNSYIFIKNVLFKTRWNSAPLLEDEDEAPLFTQVPIGCHMKFK